MTKTPVDVQHQPARGRPPVGPRLSAWQWLRRNLFNTWYNTLLTLVLAPTIAYAAYQVLGFVFVTGRWEIIEVNLTNLMVGQFSRDELWRLWVAITVLTVVVGLGLGITSRMNQDAARAQGVEITTSWRTVLRRAVPALLLVAAMVVFVQTATPLVLLLAVVAVGMACYYAGRQVGHRGRRWLNAGVVAALVAAFVVITQFDGVPLSDWGGFLLTAFLAVGGITLSFPLGILLALGRQSTLPAIRVVSVAYIELMRGVPLIALLFMGWLIIPFFLPRDFPTPGLIWRALIAFILFTAAYVAEIVRGGLQSLPKGQYEAAHALGLPTWKMMRLVILPQALRNVIPAMVGQFISLFKDTSLVLVIGLTDLLAVSRAITSQDRFLGQGLHAETLLFASFLYWVGSYWMSRESQRMERRLGLGER